MDEIKLAISVPNNYDYRRIVLRKFFYMIFIDANGNKLYAYIASVFGGVTDYKADTPAAAYKAIQYKTGVECSLHFEIQANDKIAHVNSVKNITGSLIKQTDKLKPIWGECTRRTKQEDLTSDLKEFYPDLFETPPDSVISVSDKNILKIVDKYPERNCIVTEGFFWQDSPSSNVYELSCPESNSDASFDGIEAINWVKIEIGLEKNILEVPILFSISLERDRIFTPDFTWYFAPPQGTVISAESYVKIGDEKVNNAIQSVSDETTVYFDEWTAPPEFISERKKSRVLIKGDEIAKIVDYNKLSSKKTISVSLHLDTPQAPSNRQFFYGLFIAFLMAFCSDKTRINDLYNCFNKTCTCPNPDMLCECRRLCDGITIVAPILLVLTFISSFLTPKKALALNGKRKKEKDKSGEKKKLPSSEKKKRRYFIYWVVGRLITVFLFTYVYLFWLLFPDLMRLVITSCEMNSIILKIGAAASLFLNLIYIRYCFVVLKRKLYNFM